MLFGAMWRIDHVPDVFNACCYDNWRQKGDLKIQKVMYKAPLEEAKSIYLTHFWQPKPLGYCEFKFHLKVDQTVWGNTNTN